MNKKTQELYNEITSVLISLKIPTDVAGFELIRECVYISLMEGDTLNIKQLYSMLAQKFDTNSLTAERNIRHAIECAYNASGLLAINEYYDMIIYTNDYKMTNSELIYIVVEMIKLNALKNKLKEKTKDSSTDFYDIENVS